MANKTVRFTTALLQTGKTTTGIPVPAQAIAQLDAGARPAVAVSVNGYGFRTTVGVMAGKSLLPFSAQHRKDSGLNANDRIDVELTPDHESRALPIPDDLSVALQVNAHVAAAFAKLAPSRQRADISNVNDARSADTRARRIASIVARLG